MKTKLFNRKTVTSAGLGLALLLGGLRITALAQPSPPASPVGMWDLKMSQARRGTAYIIFGEDFSITGTEIFGPPILGIYTYVANQSPIDYGAVSLDGWWAFDHAGRVVGFYTEHGTTNGIDSNLARAVSFTANVKQGQRIKLTATISSNSRIISLKGVPAVNLPDISGNYLAHGLTNGPIKIAFNETFNLQSSGGLFPNEYYILGSGAGGGATGHIFTGHALLSANKQFSFDSSHVIYNVATNYSVVDTNTMATNMFATNYWVTNFVVREFTGPINLKKFGPTSAPVALIGKSGTNHIVYKISPQAPPD